jgi:hypothetical protein
MMHNSLHLHEMSQVCAPADENPTGTKTMPDMRVTEGGAATYSLRLNHSYTTQVHTQKRNADFQQMETINLGTY